MALDAPPSLWAYHADRQSRCNGSCATSPTVTAAGNASAASLERRWYGPVAVHSARRPPKALGWGSELSGYGAGDDAGALAAAAALAAEVASASGVKGAAGAPTGTTASAAGAPPSAAVAAVRSLLGGRRRLTRRLL